MGRSGDVQRLDGVPQERRLHPRYPIDEDSTLTLINRGLPLKARIVDLSLVGCRVRTLDQFTGNVGRALEICFKVRGVAFRCRGVVRWCQGKHLLGIHFQNLIPRRQSELVEVIEELAAASAAGAPDSDPPAPERQPVMPPSRALPASPEANPKALHTALANDPPLVDPPSPQTVPEQLQPPAAEPVRPSAAVPPSARAETQPAAAPAPVRPLRRERRALARHQVDTSATILLIRAGSALPGRILDLSPGGCRIRTDKRFPVGIYTRVETEFHLHCLPFRLGGVIQAIHNQNTVGIRFLDLSQRKRQQVLELIGEIQAMGAIAPLVDSPAAEQKNSPVPHDRNS